MKLKRLIDILNTKNFLSSNSYVPQKACDKLSGKCSKETKNNSLAWGYSSAAQHPTGKQKVLSLTPGNNEKNY